MPEWFIEYLSDVGELSIPLYGIRQRPITREALELFNFLFPYMGSLIG